MDTLTKLSVMQDCMDLFSKRVLTPDTETVIRVLISNEDYDAVINLLNTLSEVDYDLKKL